MKSHTEYLTFNTPRRRELLRITDQAARVCQSSGIAEGMLLVSAMHITAGVPITKGKLDLGTWQQIFYFEFDGRRPKRLVMKALGE